MENSTPWPQTDDDPFHQQKLVKQTSNINDLSSFWETSTSTNQDHAPKWILQTDEEQIDQQKAIRAMESKLNRVKQRNYSAIPPMNDNTIDDLCTNNDDDDDDDDNGGSAVEDQEGLSLLWQERYTSEGLDEALRHQKKDRQYISSYISWISMCMCCWRS